MLRSIAIFLWHVSFSRRQWSQQLQHEPCHKETWSYPNQCMVWPTGPPLLFLIIAERESSSLRVLCRRQWTLLARLWYGNTSTIVDSFGSSNQDVLVHVFIVVHINAGSYCFRQRSGPITMGERLCAPFIPFFGIIEALVSSVANCCSIQRTYFPRTLRYGIRELSQLAAQSQCNVFSRFDLLFSFRRGYSWEKYDKPLFGWRENVYTRDFTSFHLQ